MEGESFIEAHVVYSSGRKEVMRERRMDAELLSRTKRTRNISGAKSECHCLSLLPLGLGSAGPLGRMDRDLWFGQQTRRNDDIFVVVAVQT